MQKTPLIAKDLPLSEITLRKYERPVDLEGRDFVRKLCLSVGLLQPGDSRDVVVDVLHVLLQNRKSGELSSKQVEELVKAERKINKLPMQGIASSNIRRQIKRLREIFIVEKIRNNYRINENADLGEIFEEKIQKYYIENIVSRVKEYFTNIKL